MCGPFVIVYNVIPLELGTGGHQSLSSLVVLVLGEVLDETSSQVAGFLFPLCGVGPVSTKVPSSKSETTTFHAPVFRLSFLFPKAKFPICENADLSFLDLSMVPVSGREAGRCGADLRAAKTVRAPDPQGKPPDLRSGKTPTSTTYNIPPNRNDVKGKGVFSVVFLRVFSRFSVPLL